jgi:hypothetical protein
VPRFQLSYHAQLELVFPGGAGGAGTAGIPPLEETSKAMGSLSSKTLNSKTILRGLQGFLARRLPDLPRASLGEVPVVPRPPLGPLETKTGGGDGGDGPRKRAKVEGPPPVISRTKQEPKSPQPANVYGGGRVCLKIDSVELVVTSIELCGTQEGEEAKAEHGHGQDTRFSVSVRWGHADDKLASQIREVLREGRVG